MTKTRVLAVVALAVTFLLGAVVGVLGNHLFLVRGVQHRSAHMIVHRLDRRLHLDEQQRRQVIRIVSTHQQRIRAIWNGVRPSVRQEIEAANAEISRVLTPAQRAEFQKMPIRLMPRPSAGIRFHHD